MAEYQLRNHIPLGAPATREPVTGDERYIRLSLGFTPRWYNQQLGVEFGEAWHLDPEYRSSCLVRMKEHLHDLFPEYRISLLITGI